MKSLRDHRAPLFALLVVLAHALFEPLAGQTPTTLQPIEASRMSMACLYSIVAYDDRREAISQTLDAALDEVDRIDRLMSNYREDSPLSRLNRDAARAPVTVDRELFDFIALAMRYGAESNGAFDISVGPLMKAWGFFRGGGRVPSDQDLNRARQLTGLRHVALNAHDRTIRFDRAGVELDLGGIAKGYAVDRAVAVLRRHRVTSALVSACGSTIYGLGHPPDGTHWTVDIQDPLYERRIAFSIPLKDRAVSVSGSSEKFFERDGVRYSHIMDPRTGHPVNGVLSVVVQAPTGTSGDAIDNVLFVEGVDRGRAFLRRHPDVDAAFLLPADNGWTRYDLSADRRRRKSE
jgi:FAD:protein FMN transferase